MATPVTGAQPDVFGVSTVSWSDWRDANPEGLVLSRDTGFERDYRTNPYPGSDDVDTSPFLFDGEVDGRLAAKARVVGVERGGQVADGCDVGASGVFRPRAAGRDLHFERTDEGFVDTFWFAWAAFRPDSQILPS